MHRTTKWTRRGALRLLLAFAVAAGVAVTSGCGFEVFQDSITTRVEVPIERTEEIVSTQKRFRFERDVQAASSAVLHRAWVLVESPENFDLSFVAWVDVFVVDPVTGERVLAARGRGFKPGDREVELELMLLGDVRQFVADQRVVIEWDIKQNALYRGDAEADMAALRFGLVLEIET